VVTQKDGSSSKLQVVKSAQSLAQLKKYQDKELGILVSPLPMRPKLWRNGALFHLRSWVVLVGQRAYFVQGDAVVSKVPYSAPDFSSTAAKETSDETLQMRFPTWALNENSNSAPQQEQPELFDSTQMEAILGLSAQQSRLISTRQRQIAAWVGLGFLSNQKVNLESEGARFVQHICIDFSLSSALVAEMLAVSSDCSLTSVTAATRAALTDDVIFTAEAGLAHDQAEPYRGSGLELVVDQELKVVL
jgi:hypothetical protein